MTHGYCESLWIIGIAHMDYTTGNSIYANELEDRIKFTNSGSFLPGEIKRVLEPSYNPPFYRNQLLAETMMNFHMIDRVQKNEPITKDELKELRKLGVVEGKLPNIYILATVVEIVGEKAQYIKSKAFEEKYYRELIIEYLKQFYKASREDVR